MACASHRQWLTSTNSHTRNLDSLQAISNDPRHIFINGDIGDSECVRQLLNEHRPMGVINFAAESHVDRSIDGPAVFVETNVLGTFRLLEEVRTYWNQLPKDEQRDFRFVHVSTDEVYGSLGDEGSSLKRLPTHQIHLIQHQNFRIICPGVSPHLWCQRFNQLFKHYGPYQFPENSYHSLS